MSVDADDFEGAAGIPRKALVFGGGALVFLGIVWFLNRAKSNTAAVGTPDTGSVALDTSGNIVIPASAIYGYQNALLNGPWSEGAQNISAGTDTSSPDGGADSGGIIIPPPAMGPAPLDGPGDRINGNGKTLNQIAQAFGVSATDFYYATGNQNGPLDAYLQSHGVKNGLGYGAIVIPASVSMTVPSNAHTIAKGTY